MNTSDSIAKISPALAAALGEIHNATKDSANPHFKSRYASLASVIDATKATLATHGLVVIQSPGWRDKHVTVTTRLLHTSGEWIESTAETPTPKQDPQGVGSAVTYLRRYALAAMCGITQDDDDGHTASQKPAPKPAPADAVDPAEWEQLGIDVDLVIDLVDAKTMAGIRRVMQTRDASRFEGLREFVTGKLADSGR